MPRTFDFALHPKDERILRILASGKTPATPENMQQVQVDLGELYQFVQKTFGERPFRLMTVLADMHLAMDKDGELATQGSLAMAQAFNVERAAYATDRATLRLQFNRLFRENNLGDRFKAFMTEQEALAFLSDG